VTWPIGMGSGFKGVYNLLDKNLYHYQAGKTVVEKERRLFESLDDPELDVVLGSDAERLRKDVVLVEGVYEPFSVSDYLAGHVAPVFFGSALNNFGVRELLETFLDIAPPPVTRAADTRKVSRRRSSSAFRLQDPREPGPAPPDRIAFLRCARGTSSGTGPSVT